jgi:hypothetical protein
MTDIRTDLRLNMIFLSAAESPTVSFKTSPQVSLIHLVLPFSFLFSHLICGMDISTHFPTATATTQIPHLSTTESHAGAL